MADNTATETPTAKPRDPAAEKAAMDAAALGLPDSGANMDGKTVN